MTVEEFNKSIAMLTNGGDEVFIALCAADVKHFLDVFEICEIKTACAKGMRELLRKTDDLIDDRIDAVLAVYRIPRESIQEIVGESKNGGRKIILIGAFESKNGFFAEVACCRKR